MPRANGSYIVVMDDFVLKSCVPAPAEVYKRLMVPSPLPFATSVSLSKPRIETTSILEVRPVCLPEMPQSLNELCIAIKGVLTALAELHRRECVHRDVRWPNILKDGDRWILADFELADLVGEPVPPGAIASAHLPPEMLADAAARYQRAGDIFCVGRLVDVWRWTEPLTAEARAWSARLTSADVSARPTAEFLLVETSGWLVTDNA